MVDAYNGTSFKLKKEEDSYTGTTWVNPEDIMLSQINQSLKELQQHMIPLIGGVQIHQDHRDRKQNVFTVLAGVDNEDLFFDGYRVSVQEDKNFEDSWWPCLHNNMNVLHATELCM